MRIKTYKKRNKEEPYIILLFGIMVLVLFFGGLFKALTNRVDLSTLEIIISLPLIFLAGIGIIYASFWQFKNKDIINEIECDKFKIMDKKSKFGKEEK